MKFEIYVAAASLCVAVSVSAGNRSIYVSPDGDDGAAGDENAPFRTLQRALNEHGKTGDADTLFIEMASGDYFMDGPVVISESGGGHVVVRGNGSDMPRLMGGIRIFGWEKAGGKNIYRAKVPEVSLYGFRFEQFYVNGRRAVWARTPDMDWHYVEDSREYPMSGSGKADFAVQKFVLDADDIASIKTLSEKELSEVRFRFYHKWDVTRKRAEYIAADSGYVYCVGAGMKPWNPVTKGSRYVMYGYRAALDSPGEWWLDADSGYIYYYPREGENLSSAECVAPVLHKWMVIRGTVSAPVENISFESISFQYTSYIMSDSGNEPMQAAAGVSAAIELDYARNISFYNCEMRHTGGYALWLRTACVNNVVRHCFVVDLGAGGIKIGETSYRRDTALFSRFNTVDNNIIMNAGNEFPCGVGVAIFHSSDNSVTHNDISNLKYSGVSVGWTWGYNTPADSAGPGRKSPAVRNLIAWNHIHHIGWGELSDMGAVYTLGESYGTRIVNNVIHDVWSYDYGGWGLYTDEGSTGVEISSNLVYRCKSGGFHQHYGRENVIENNIFAFGYFYQAQFTRPESHLSFHFHRNIILQDRGETLSGPWDKGNIDIDRNIYWHVSGEPIFAGRTFTEWQEKHDSHSFIVDPLFVDAKKDNYEFKSLREARRIGFKPFDVASAGVYGSMEWKEKAKSLSRDIEAEFSEVSMSRLEDIPLF